MQRTLNLNTGTDSKCEIRFIQKIYHLTGGNAPLGLIMHSRLGLIRQVQLSEGVRSDVCSKEHFSLIGFWLIKAYSVF